MSNRLRRGRGLTIVAGLGVASLALAACGGSSDTATDTATDAATDAATETTETEVTADDSDVAVSLILKNLTNPFFVAMSEGAKQSADELGVGLTVAAAKDDTDTQGQVAAVENAVAQGQNGILITPVGAGVNDAISAAREAGLFVIALDTPTDPPDVVDITFATDNFLAGLLIGEWMAGKLDGQKAVIARLIITESDAITVDYKRDNGFLQGMGIDIADATVIGDEATTGTYTAGKGGEYEIACIVGTLGNEEGGQTGMENCLSANPDINVVYTINEPAALGANEALKAAGKTPGQDVFIVSVDGGLAGVEAVRDGIIGATSQQYPLRMAAFGVQAIFDIVKSGVKPENTSADGEFFDTGVTLCTDEPQDTVVSGPQESAQYCIDNAWG